MKHLTTCLVVVSLNLGLASVALADAGEDTFNAKCSVCHGKDGKGKTKMGEKLKAKDLTDAAVQAAVTDEKMEKEITEGIPDKKMPGQKDKLSGDEIKGVVKFVRSLKGK